MRIAATILCAAALSGCGYAWAWHRPQATPREFAADKYECVMQARSYGSAGGAGQTFAWSSSGPETDLAVYNACMGARGWERQWGGAFKWSPSLY